MTSASVEYLEPSGVVHSSDSPPRDVLRVILAHRQPLVREGTRHILESQPGYVVVAETVSLATAAPLIEQFKPDVVVLGLETDEIEARTYIRQLRNVLSSTRVLVLNDVIPPQRLARLGVNGW